VHRIFILSPANSAGERANLLYNPRARFDLARKLQRGEKVPLGEIFSFLSGLYFRGKFNYALTFARPPESVAGAYVITSNCGLIPAVQPISLRQLKAFAATEIDPREIDYVRPLKLHSKRLVKIIGSKCEVVLLGSIGTKKYAEILAAHFGERLLFPASFVGRGDMSRGGLLLRCVSEHRELEYLPVLGSVRHGKRPEKLAPKRWGFRITEGKTTIGIPKLAK